MNLPLSLLLLAVPALLVAAASYLLRRAERWRRNAIWLIPAITWSISIWFWGSYARQQDDVGLMVHGILASATAVSAFAATVVAYFWWNRQ